MLFFRQLIIPGRQPLDKALDLQQRQRGQYAPGGQLRFVDHPVDRLLSALQLPQNGGFVGRYARQNFLYVTTSKLESMARQVLTHFDLMQYFDGVCGGIADDPEAGKKANVVRRALREAEYTEYSRAILSGDREYDIYGGHAAGIQTVGVLYGYGSREELEKAGADALAETPEALLALLL